MTKPALSPYCVHGQRGHRHISQRCTVGRIVHFCGNGRQLCNVFDFHPNLLVSQILPIAVLSGKTSRLESETRFEIPPGAFSWEKTEILLSRFCKEHKLVWCPVNTFTQTGAILRLSKAAPMAAVPRGTVPWARTRLRHKSALFPRNEAALRGSPRWSAGESPTGIPPGCPPCAAPQWRSHLCKGIYGTPHLESAMCLTTNLYIMIFFRDYADLANNLLAIKNPVTFPKT